MIVVCLLYYFSFYKTAPTEGPAQASHPHADTHSLPHNDMDDECGSIKKKIVPSQYVLSIPFGNQVMNCAKKHSSSEAESVCDLSGQFSREPEVSVHDMHEGMDPLKKEATMEVKGNTLLVTR